MTTGDCWLDHKAEESQNFAGQTEFNRGSVKQKPTAPIDPDESD
jgi:hypothetical protein